MAKQTPLWKAVEQLATAEWLSLIGQLREHIHNQVDKRGPSVSLIPDAEAAAEAKAAEVEARFAEAQARLTEAHARVAEVETASAEALADVQEQATALRAAADAADAARVQAVERLKEMAAGFDKSASMAWALSSLDDLDRPTIVKVAQALFEGVRIAQKKGEELIRANEASSDIRPDEPGGNAEVEEEEERQEIDEPEEGPGEGVDTAQAAPPPTSLEGLIIERFGEHALRRLPSVAIPPEVSEECDWLAAHGHDDLARALHRAGAEAERDPFPGVELSRSWLESDATTPGIYEVAVLLRLAQELRWCDPERELEVVHDFWPLFDPDPLKTLAEEDLFAMVLVYLRAFAAEEDAEPLCDFLEAVLDGWDIHKRYEEWLTRVEEESPDEAIKRVGDEWTWMEMKLHEEQHRLFLGDPDWELGTWREERADSYAVLGDIRDPVMRKAYMKWLTAINDKMWEDAYWDGYERVPGHPLSDALAVYAGAEFIDDEAARDYLALLPSGRGLASQLQGMSDDELHLEGETRRERREERREMWSQMVGSVTKADLSARVLHSDDPTWIADFLDVITLNVEAAERLRGALVADEDEDTALDVARMFLGYEDEEDEDEDEDDDPSTQGPEPSTAGESKKDPAAEGDELLAGWDDLDLNDPGILNTQKPEEEPSVPAPGQAEADSEPKDPAKKKPALPKTKEMIELEKQMRALGLGDIDFAAALGLDGSSDEKLSPTVATERSPPQELDEMLARLAADESRTEAGEKAPGASGKERTLDLMTVLEKQFKGSGLGDMDFAAALGLDQPNDHLDDKPSGEDQ